MRKKLITTLGILLAISLLTSCQGSIGPITASASSEPTATMTATSSPEPTAAQASSFTPAAVSTSSPTPQDVTESLGPASTDDPTCAEAVSVVFMGEKITAPGSYPGVPDLYSPVLDDLYLYGAVTQRYEVLNHDGMVTTEIMHECENVQSEIRQRGHLPYPGDGSGAAGYALLDLDGDKSPELLLFTKSPGSDSIEPTSFICAVYAIRKGQLVCIDNGSSELEMATILAVDGTFYQCVDWGGVGYVNLNAFRLVAGMSEFTTVSEAYSSLSFSEGDVPVPYWVKIEDGEEITITEDEFDALVVQYKNPDELMPLDFIPLHPNYVDPWSVPRPTDESPTTPIEYPKSYQCAPSEYKPILDALFLLQEHMTQDEYGTGEDLEAVGFTEYPYPRDGKLGYALVDLNNDGVLELLLGSVDGLDNSAPNSIFMLKEGIPVLLDSFWSRSRGVIATDGTIYSIGSGGAAYTYLSSYRLDKNADTLTQLTDMRSDYSESEGKPYYVQVENGKNHYITEKEFSDFLEKYDNPTDKMVLTVIPIQN